MLLCKDNTIIMLLYLYNKESGLSQNISIDVDMINLYRYKLYMQYYTVFTFSAVNNNQVQTALALLWVCVYIRIEVAPL